MKNGELLQLAASQFDVLLTADRNLEYQQNFTGLALAAIVVHAPSNDVAMLRPLMPAVLAAISQTNPGTVTHIRGYRPSAAPTSFTPSSLDHSAGPASEASSHPFGSTIKVVGMPIALPIALRS